MKQLLILILLCSLHFCYGQIIFRSDLKLEDTAYNVPHGIILGLDKRFYADTIAYGTTVRFEDRERPAVYDTISSILFYIDTARNFMVSETFVLNDKQDTSSMFIFGDIKNDTTWLNYDYSIKWMYGYSVREKEWVCCKDAPTNEYGYRTSQAFFYWRYGFNVKYLDGNKEPLSRDILVWMSK
jgi:hypothetical protein